MLPFGKSSLGATPTHGIEGGSAQAVVVPFASSGGVVALGSVAAGGNSAQAGVPVAAGVAAPVSVNKRSRDENGGMEQDRRDDYRPSKRPRLLSADNGEMMVSSSGNSALVKRGGFSAADRAAAEHVSSHPRADTPALVMEGVHRPPERQRLLSWVHGETWLCFSNDQDNDTLSEIVSISGLAVVMGSGGPPSPPGARADFMPTILADSESLGWLLYTISGVKQQRLGFLESIQGATRGLCERSLLPVGKYSLLGQAQLLDAILQAVEQHRLGFLESTFGATLGPYEHSCLPVLECSLLDQARLYAIQVVEQQRRGSLKSILEATLESYKCSLFPVEDSYLYGHAQLDPIRAVEQQRLVSLESILVATLGSYKRCLLPVSALLRQERLDTILQVEKQRLGFLEWILRTTLVSYKLSFLPVWKSSSLLLGQAGLDTILQEMKQQRLGFLESILGATLVSFEHSFRPVVEKSSCLPGHEQLGTILKVEQQRFVSLKSTLEETLYERSLLPVGNSSSTGTSMVVPMICNAFSSD